MGKLICCVEDDDNIRELVVYALMTAGYESVGYSCASDFYKGIQEKKPNLVLLDIMLPDEDGITILRNLRSRKDMKAVPVIMLTAKSAEYDKVRGLDSGADDYVTKPFGVMELLSRVKAVLRRTEKEEAEEDSLSIGGLRVDEKKHEVYVNGRLISLTFKEFELLSYLMKNKDIVLSRDKILNTIWNYEYEGESRTVDVHIGSLRHKLGECGDMIKTIRGVGYKIGE